MYHPLPHRSQQNRSQRKPLRRQQPLSPAATPTFAPSVRTSKYDKIFVYTIEDVANEERSLLHVSYPVSENPAISERMKAVADQFIAEYQTTAAEQEKAYQAYLSDTGQEAASLSTQYIQHFDLTLANESLIFFAIEQYRTTGGTGGTDVTAYIFDTRDRDRTSDFRSFRGQDLSGSLVNICPSGARTACAKSGRGVNI